MAAPAERPLASRVRHAIVFVAIVWGIAATFVAFELLALSGMDVALSFADGFSDIALSRAVTQSTSCTRARRGRHGRRAEGRGLRDARVGAWLLGVSLGRDAVVRQLSGANPQSLEQTADRLRVLAGRLGVPTPSLFRAIRSPTPTRSSSRSSRMTGAKRHAAWRRRFHRKRASCSSLPRCGDTQKWFARYCLESAPSSRWKSGIMRAGRRCRSRCGVR